MVLEQAEKDAGPRRARALVVCAGLLLSGAALSQQAVSLPIYSCVAGGRTYSGDRPPPECSNSDIRELNRDGSLRRVIPRPLTVAEQRAKAVEAQKRAEEEEKALAQRRRDRSLLEAYANEDEIEAARLKAIASSTDILERSRVRLDRMDNDKKRLDDESDFFKKREVPEHIKRARLNNEQEKAVELKIVQDAQAEMQRINARFDGDKQRFRELMSQGARPAQRSPRSEVVSRYPSR
jgi:hypothetical protein